MREEIPIGTPLSSGFTYTKREPVAPPPPTMPSPPVVQRFIQLLTQIESSGIDYEGLEPFTELGRILGERPSVEDAQRMRGALQAWAWRQPGGRLATKRFVAFANGILDGILFVPDAQRDRELERERMVKAQTFWIDP